MSCLVTVALKAKDLQSCSALSKKLLAIWEVRDESNQNNENERHYLEAVTLIS